MIPFAAEVRRISNTATKTMADAHQAEKRTNGGDWRPPAAAGGPAGGDAGALAEMRVRWRGCGCAGGGAGALAGVRVRLQAHEFPRKKIHSFQLLAKPHVLLSDGNLGNFEKKFDFFSICVFFCFVSTVNW